MRLHAFLVLASAPLLALAVAACVDGATPDCTSPTSGCIVVPADGSTTDATDAASEASDASTSDANDADATPDAPKADAGDAKID